MKKKLSGGSQRRRHRFRRRLRKKHFFPATVCPFESRRNDEITEDRKKFDEKLNDPCVAVEKKIIFEAKHVRCKKLLVKWQILVLDPVSSNVLK